MNNVVLFGTGNYAELTIKLINKEEVLFFVDNDEKKAGNCLCGIPIYLYKEKRDELRSGNYKIIIAVSEKYEDEIKIQMENDGIMVADTISHIRLESIKRDNLESQNYLEIYKNAIKWIHDNSVENEGIIVHTSRRVAYPEVTGYCICSLLKWGYRKKAIDYAKWLINIQKEDGSWPEPSLKDSYVFDSAQILKGLIAIRDILPEVDDAIIKGCDWIISNVDSNGKLNTPTEEMWAGKETCSELVHIYCLSPLVKASEIYNKSEYREVAYRVLNYYKNNYEYEIKHFSLMSHFYAYVIEGLVDMGEIDMAREAMENLKQYQKDNGEIPAYNNVHWICSTGLFQIALIWYKLNDVENGKNCFECACKLQNASGGWFGSYLSVDHTSERSTYFPNEEISWAVKYFLDALYFKNKAEFNKMAHIFQEKIDPNDGRYVCIENIVNNINSKNSQARVLDIGCGKGRYIKNLKYMYPNMQLYAVDLSREVLRYIDVEGINVIEGSLTNLPYSGDMFDFVYSCEALEHAIDIENAIKEMARITKKGGIIAVVDKNEEKLGLLRIEKWEQWFEEDELKAEMLKYCSEVNVVKNIAYENKEADGLFYCWIGTKK